MCDPELGGLILARFSAVRATCPTAPLSKKNVDAADVQEDDDDDDENAVAATLTALKKNVADRKSVV